MENRNPQSCRDEYERDGQDNHDHHVCTHANCDHESHSAREQTLYPYIDTTKITCLNEHKHGAGKTVFKPWSERRNTKWFVKSGEDEELLFHVPFTVSVSVQSIVVIGGEEGTSPSSVKLFRNKDHIDFSNAEDIKPDQELQLNEDSSGSLEYQLKRAKFQNTNSLTLYFPESFGGDETKIYYIGLKGVATNHRRQVIETVYEAKPIITDHKIKEDIGTSRTIE